MKQKSHDQPTYPAQQIRNHFYLKRGEI